MTPPLLICSDLDRTLLPNGDQPESPGVRDMFSRLVSRREVHLAYVSGRDLALVLDAIETYRLPVPQFIIGDVGTSIYAPSPEEWSLSIPWQAVILEDWRGWLPARLMEELDAIAGMTLQEPARQGPAKISFYIDGGTDRSELERTVRTHLERLGVRYRLVWSKDEAEYRGLLDILPSSASKLHAIEFLITS